MRQAICSPSRADNSWTCTHHLNGGLTRARQVLTWADGGLHKPAGQTLQRAIGIDVGHVRTGVAVATPTSRPEPLQIVSCRGVTPLDVATELLQIAARQGADGFVVGLPVTLNGTLTRRNTDSQQGRRCRNFAENLQALAKRQGLPVYLYNEVFTSLAAASSLGMDRKSRLQQAGKLDAAAAAALLRSYYADPSQAVLVELKRKWHSERPQR